MSTGTTTPTVPTAPTSTPGGLTNWAQQYIIGDATNPGYLSQAAALGNSPYQMYQGPLTAGASPLQQQAFQGIGALTVPGSVSNTGAQAQNMANQLGGLNYTPGTFNNQYTAPTPYQAGTFTGGTFGTQQAQQYMNPYLQSALNPQLEELRRQSQITQMGNDARMTRAGAFGGSRQALMTTENQRNLMSQMDRTLGQGYSDAYDRATAQYNADQARRMEADRMREQSRQFGYGQSMEAAGQRAQYGQAAANAGEASRQFGAGYRMDALQGGISGLGQAQQQGLAGLNAQSGILNDQLRAGQIQRDIESEGIAADYDEFQNQRQFPYQQLQFQRDMLSGLPAGALMNNTPAQMSGVAQLLQGLAGVNALSGEGSASLNTLLNNLGLGNLFGSNS